MTSIFSSVITSPIERIDVEDITDATYQQHCLKVYEKMRMLDEAQQNPQLAEKEAVETLTPQKKVMLKVPSQSPTSPEVKDVESTTTIEIDGKLLTIPIVARGGEKRWLKYLAAREYAIQNQILEILKIKQDTTSSSELFSKWKRIAESTPVGPKTRSKLDTIEKYIVIALAEHWITEQTAELAEVAEELAYTQAVVDDGIWLEANTLRGKDFISKIATEYVPVTKVDQLSSREVKHLATIIFSREPTARAIAKLDLKANLKPNVHTEVMKAPEDHLEIALAAAELTSEEILAIVFQHEEKEKAHKCMSCGKRVVIASTFYHPACKTMDWLEKHTRYRRDTTTGAVALVERGYIDPETRARFSRLLKLYYETHRDIVVRTGNQTTVWQRQADFSLKKIPIASRRDDEIVGSHAWMKKQGFIH